MRAANLLTVIIQLLLCTLGLYAFFEIIGGADLGGRLYDDLVLGTSPYPWIALLAACLLVFVERLTGRVRRRERSFIAFQGRGGRISISTGAIGDFVQRIGEEFSSVLSMRTHIVARGSALELDVDVRLVEGAHVQELCQVLQDRISEEVRDRLGLGEVRAVRIRVKDIVRGARSADRAGNQE